MDYIIFDLEFNQAFNFGSEHRKTSNPICPFEIIHIGAVKLDENLKLIGKLDKLVKPNIYTRLHPYVKKITRIKASDLKSAKNFKSVYNELSKFMTEKSILCVWGTSDIHELHRNAKYHKLDTSIIPEKYIDIQRYANIHLNHPKGTSISLSNAVELLSIPHEFQFHNAFNDAYYTAEVFRKIYNEQIRPENYHLPQSPKNKNHVNKKIAVNTDKIIKRFEKIFERKMTAEEQYIIKMAYRMGNINNQFQKRD